MRYITAEVYMGLLKGKENATPSLEEQLKEQAKKMEISIVELKKLGEGKKCPKYGVKELLHTRKVRGGKIVVFNISDRHRGEKISKGRSKLKASASH
jgi:hypothetical protein